MIAIILAAGYGTRLYPLTKNQAKPLLNVCSRPLIDYIIDKLKTVEDCKKIFVVTNDKFFKDFSSWQKRHALCKKIKIVNDKTKNPEDRLGAVGDIFFTIRHKKISDDILVLGGDNFFQESLDGFIEFAENKTLFSVLGAFDIKNKAKARRFGIIKLDKKNKIINFQEKPKTPSSTLAATCLYFFPKEKLSLFKEYNLTHHSKDASGSFIQWLYRREDVYGYVFSKKWFDIGHKDSYKEINNFLKRKELQ